MSIETITATLSDHQGSWDSFGWHCACGAREDFAPVVEGPLPRNFAVESRGALLDHQAQAVANA